MRRLLPLVILTVLALTNASASDVQAKGGAVGISPDAGEMGTVVELWSEDWPANEQVRIYGAFTSSLFGDYPDPSEFVGPLAEAQSDSAGDWNARLEIKSRPGLAIPNQPGFVVFRAESDDLPPYLVGYNTGHFVLTVDGRRPAGAGEIRVSLSTVEGVAATAGFFGWRPAGAANFTTPYALIPLPFETTIGSLDDGEWEIAVIGQEGVEPVGKDIIHIGATNLCLNPSCSGAPVFQVHYAQRVSIRDAEVVDVNVTVGRPREASSEALSQDEPARSSAGSRGETAAVIAGAGAALVALMGSGLLLGMGRARP